MYYFLAAYELFRLTGDPSTPPGAKWPPTGSSPGSTSGRPEQDEDSPLQAAGFNAIGWPTVSVQNHHLDTFFPTYELLSFGLTTNNP